VLNLGIHCSSFFYNLVDKRMASIRLIQGNMHRKLLNTSFSGFFSTLAGGQVGGLESRRKLYKEFGVFSGTISSKISTKLL
jgi:hypothetical protein